jgi:peptide/nickel transport system ATP-binding protein
MSSINENVLVKLNKRRFVWIGTLMIISGSLLMFKAIIPSLLPVEDEGDSLILALVTYGIKVVIFGIFVAIFLLTKKNAKYTENQYYLKFYDSLENVFIAEVVIIILGIFALVPSLVGFVFLALSLLILIVAFILEMIAWYRFLKFILNLNDKHPNLRVFGFIGVTLLILGDLLLLLLQSSAQIFPIDTLWMIISTIPYTIGYIIVGIIFYIIPISVVDSITKVPSERANQTIQDTKKTNDDSLLIVKNLKGHYKGSFGIVQGCDGVSLKVKKGEIVAIAGESGCGKSTLAELVSGTPRPVLHFESGEVIVDNYDVYRIDPELLRTKIKCERMSYVPQASLESLNPVKKLSDFIIDVVKQRTGETNPNKNKILKMAGDHFVRVGLDRKILRRYPHELSGGMKQRAVIAISTLWNPKLLIIDEPTSALDVSSQQRMIRMLYEMMKNNLIEAILFVSHDIASLRQLCNRAVIMYAGKIVEEGDMDEIIDKPLHPYTKGLVTSFVSYNPDGSKPKLLSIPGSHPSLINPPSGCRFHPRCSKCMEICKTNEPPMFSPEMGRRVKCWLYDEGEKK